MSSTRFSPTSVFESSTSTSFPSASCSTTSGPGESSVRYPTTRTPVPACRGFAPPSNPAGALPMLSVVGACSATTGFVALKPFVRMLAKLLLAASTLAVAAAIPDSAVCNTDPSGIDLPRQDEKRIHPKHSSQSLTARFSRQDGPSAPPLPASQRDAILQPRVGRASDLPWGRLNPNGIQSFSPALIATAIYPGCGG